MKDTLIASLCVLIIVAAFAICDALFGLDFKQALLIIILIYVVKIDIRQSKQQQNDNTRH